MFGGHAISYLKDKNVISLASGSYHSIAVTSNGMLYTFGREYLHVLSLNVDY